MIHRTARPSLLVIFGCTALLTACVADETAQKEGVVPDAGTAVDMGSQGAGGSGGMGGMGDEDAASGTGGMDGGSADTGPRDDGISDPEDMMTATPPPTRLGGMRPATYFLPQDYDPSVPMPLIISLHGYTGSGVGQNAYLGLSELTAVLGTLLVIPNGRRNGADQRFWSATDFCCDFGNQGDVDVAYIRGLIDEAKTHFSIDEERVGLIGHSNGGFMAYRLACEASDLITAVVSLAGTSWADADRCGMPDPVSVLHAHGTWDATIRYEGRVATDGDPLSSPDYFGCRTRACAEPAEACDSDPDCVTLARCSAGCGWTDAGTECRQRCWLEAGESTRELWFDDLLCTVNAGCWDNPAEASPGYASADEMMERWRTRNGCMGAGMPGDPLDLTHERPGVDTRVTQWAACARETRLEQWRMNRVGHVPGFRSAFGANIIAFILGNPRTIEE
jgi:poly(3-hydroxybutyrate) depolymerase